MSPPGLSFLARWILDTSEFSSVETGRTRGGYATSLQVACQELEQMVPHPRRHPCIS
jgi:hypothetical protein